MAGDGLVGGLRSIAQDGSFVSGFLAAGFSSAAGQSLQDLGTNAAGIPYDNVVTSAVSGGIGSVLGGGKFANGAETGAFGYLFNSCQGRISCAAEGVADAFDPTGGIFGVGPGGGLGWIPGIGELAPGEYAIGRALGAVSDFLQVPVVIGGKIEAQMAGRGWTPDAIRDTVNNPYATSPALNRATGNPATAYFNSDGSYVVWDNTTGGVAQISNRNDPNWVPDSSITNPYKP